MEKVRKKGPGSGKPRGLGEDIEEYLSWLKEEKGKSPATLEGYRYDLAHLRRRCEKLGIEDIRETGDVLLQLHFRQRREEGASESTVAREMTAVRGFYRYWYHAGRIEYNYADALERPKTAPAPEETLTGEEMERLLEQPDTSTARGIRDRAVLELLCGAGLKTGELLALQIRDVDLQAGCITVHRTGSRTSAASRRDPKAGSRARGADADREMPEGARIVPVSRRTRAALLTYQRKVRSHYADAGEDGPADEALLFTGENGKVLSRQAVWQMVRRCGAQAGIDKKLSPAMLRRSFARDLQERGADPQTVQELLGSSDFANGL